MKFITLSFLLILVMGDIYGMKRHYEVISHDIHGQKRFCHNTVKHQEPKFILYNFLPEEIQKLIISFCTYRSFTHQPKIATHTIRNFYYTQKKYYPLITDPQFISQLINKLAYQFYCSHETIAKFLDTKESKRQLALQYELKKICDRSDYHFYQSNQATLIKLIDKGVDLEFSYNYKSSQRTALMFCTTYYNHIFNHLFTISNINTVTPHGLTALHLSAGMSPLYPFSCNKICEHPEININQQNNRGETALLYSLIRRKGCSIGNLFIKAIEKLLEKGANPELGNKYGLTPLKAAHDLGNKHIISLIEQAIQNKQRLMGVSQ